MRGMMPTDGTGWVGILFLILFMGAFILLIFQVYRARAKVKYNRYAQIPLAEDILEGQ